ncbi:acyl carrier protein [Pseudomonas sp. SBB6]|uniref:acyl carrier protein n=1 Tax=Pseudomonas sp. SBB6 TaxID=2962032 RepID=UPI0020B73B83|nr:acyl carrier protein [Pseudomonas sp. SBB6]MCP3751631.1 acyl carrier protein [Pseudomonas sp. SBB6]
MNTFAMAPLPALSALTQTTVSEWISYWLAERDYDEYLSICADTPFSEMGLSSIDAVELATELSHASKVPLDATIAWQYPTPATLAGYIADAAASRQPDDAVHTAPPAVTDNPAFQHLDEQAMADLLESLLSPAGKALQVR